jgi:hypothetical protein
MHAYYAWLQADSHRAGTSRNEPVAGGECGPSPRLISLPPPNSRSHVDAGMLQVGMRSPGEIAGRGPSRGALEARTGATFDVRGRPPTHAHASHTELDASETVLSRKTRVNRFYQQLTRSSVGTRTIRPPQPVRDQFCPVSPHATPVRFHADGHLNPARQAAR